MATECRARTWGAALLLGLLPGCRSLRGSEAAAGLQDHHVHLLGPTLVADWKALGAEFSRPDAAYASADGLLGSPAGSEPGLTGAWLVPMAHLYGNEEFRLGLGLSEEEEERRAHAENLHVAHEAARRPGTTVALVSVDPLRPWALRELERMRHEPGVIGVKVHLACAGFDFGAAEHLTRLERVVAWVEEAGQVLLLHLDPRRRGTEAGDVTRLLEIVLGPHPEANVVIAHLGGSGGFGPWTQAVLATLTTWLDDEAARGHPRRGFFVDLSAVPMIRESEGVPPTSAEELAALAPALRRLGLERVLFGSDYPVFDSREHARFLRERSGLSEAELAPILARGLRP